MGTRMKHTKGGKDVPHEDPRAAFFIFWPGDGEAVAVAHAPFGSPVPPRGSPHPSTGSGHGRTQAPAGTRTEAVGAACPAEWSRLDGRGERRDVRGGTGRRVAAQGSWWPRADGPIPLRGAHGAL